MKLKYILFLAKANCKGNSHSGLIVLLVAILVISLTVISSLSITLSNGMDDYRNDFRARTIEAYPDNKIFDEKTLQSVRNINHVESVDIEDETRNQFFSINNISDENGKYDSLQNQIDEKDTIVNVWSLIGGEKRSVIAGKNLDDAPTFSCIIPQLFYPFDEDVYATDSLEYLDAESLIGTTLTLLPSGGYFTFDYFDGTDSKRAEISEFEVKLTIVGVYYSSPTADGGPDTIYVSEETGKELMKTAVDYAKGGKEELERFINHSEYHNIHITVDNFDNINYVYDELQKMKIYVIEGTELGINPETPLITNLFNILSIFLTTSTFLVTFILMLYFSSYAIKNKKEEIGLMKAVGYKNGQIFGIITLEQLLTTLKGFALGTVISAIAITVINIIFSNGSYANRIFIVNPALYLLITAVALLIAILVPIICEILVLHKLFKIQPKDAMN
ncbi:ABC transporter permease [Ruminococcus sp.]|uniref:ABC transporter permease n=1 Tax=Ruminococcus sp. TaxID=41978 RepID=UPI003F07993F